MNGPVLVGVILAGTTAWAQTSTARPAFEAASVKTVEGGRIGLGSLRGGPGTSSPGQLTGSATLKLLLMRAYELKDYQIAGPGWLDSARFEVQAKLPPGARREDVGPMLQALLAERFGLAAHREKRQMAGYELRVEKGGAKVRASRQEGAAAEEGVVIPSPRFVRGEDGLPDLAPGTEVARTYAIVMSGPDGLMNKVWGRRQTMAQLADRLSAHENQPVVDATGLKGEYDFTLSWAVEGGGGTVPRTGPPPDQIETASAPVLSGSALPLAGALQKQLGLRLERRRMPIEVLVIDRVNTAPTAN